MEEQQFIDLLVARLMSGKVNDFYSGSYSKNIAKGNEPKKWINLTAEEATEENIINAAKMAYKIAKITSKVRDEFITNEVREQYDLKERQEKHAPDRDTSYKL